MRLLLDTHALVWWLAGNEALSPTARTAIADEGNESFVSAVSTWEIAIKHRSGKMPIADSFIGGMQQRIFERFSALSITVGHGQAAGQLPGPHRDPFDRMLIAQALEEKLVLVSNERLFDSYGVGRLW